MFLARRKPSLLRTTCLLLLTFFSFGFRPIHAKTDIEDLAASRGWWALENLPVVMNKMHKEDVIKVVCQEMEENLAAHEDYQAAGFEERAEIRWQEFKKIFKEKLISIFKKTAPSAFYLVKVLLFGAFVSIVGAFFLGEHQGSQDLHD